MDKNTVLVGMSGGVDSSVAAYLLKEQGYNVIGAYMSLFDTDKEFEVKIENNINDARKVCEHLDIPFHVLDLKKEFKNDVIEYFTEEYFMGRTPNPCAICNKKIKFGKLLDAAHDLGAYYVATGHYSTVDYNKDTERYFLNRAVSTEKDQSYMFYSLSQDQLKHIIMPLGVVADKGKVRQIAAEIGLDIASKTDSQEICFIPDDDYIKFLKENSAKKSKDGEFKDLDGNVLGKHKGIINYTIGQRKGLGVSFGKPTYVIAIDSKKNEVIVGDNEDVFAKKLMASNINFIPFDRLDEPRQFSAKIRYNAKPALCMVTQIDDNNMLVEFEENERAITAGQFIVLYDDDLLVGGGVINNIVK